jgi:hypothetical protein
MNRPIIDAKQALSRGAVVVAVPELTGVQSLEGDFILRENLGPGIVEQVDEAQGVRVRWVDTHAAAWVSPDDLQPLGADARLVVVYQRDEGGDLKLVRRGVVTTAGLRTNWNVELLPNEVVRAVRPDGSAWTFDWDRNLGRMNTRNTKNMWMFPPQDDDTAEALTVAELSVFGLNIKETGRQWQWLP